MERTMAYLHTPEVQRKRTESIRKAWKKRKRRAGLARARLAKRAAEPKSESQPQSTQPQSILSEEARILDTLEELNIPELLPDRKRQLSFKQKAGILAAYKALRMGSEARGLILKKHHLHWGMLNRWERELEQEGIRLPDLSMTNGAASGRAPAKRGRPRGRPPAIANGDHFEEAERGISRNEAAEALLSEREHLMDQVRLIDKTLEIWKRVRE